MATTWWGNSDFHLFIFSDISPQEHNGLDVYVMIVLQALYLSISDIFTKKKTAKKAKQKKYCLMKAEKLSHTIKLMSHWNQFHRKHEFCCPFSHVSRCFFKTL